MAGDALMIGGEAIACNGEALMSEGEPTCLCGGTPTCPVRCCAGIGVLPNACPCGAGAPPGSPFCSWTNSLPTLVSFRGFAKTQRNSQFPPLDLMEVNFNIPTQTWLSGTEFGQCNYTNNTGTNGVSGGAFPVFADFTSQSQFGLTGSGTLAPTVTPMFIGSGAFPLSRPAWWMSLQFRMRHLSVPPPNNTVPGMTLVWGWSWTAGAQSVGIRSGVTTNAADVVVLNNSWTATVLATFANGFPRRWRITGHGRMVSAPHVVFVSRGEDELRIDEMIVELSPTRFADCTELSPGGCENCDDGGL